MSMEPVETWSWWVSHDGEHYTTECATREEAIQIARDEYDGAHILEATKHRLQLADFFCVETFLESADESAIENFGNEDGDSLIELTLEQTASLKVAACNAMREWQTASGLVLDTYAFAQRRNAEYVPGTRTGEGA